MDVRVMFGIILITGSSPMAIADGFPYRLSGVIHLDNDRSIAIIETEAGKERLFHKGDELGTGTIIEIGEKQVRLTTPEGEKILGLKGTGVSRQGSLPETPSPETVKITDSIPALAEQIGELSGRLVGGATSDETVATSGLNSILGLPAKTVITAVDDRHVGSAVETIGRLKRILEKREDPVAISFTVDGVEGTDRVYRFPRGTEGTPN